MIAGARNLDSAESKSRDSPSVSLAVNFYVDGKEQADKFGYKYEPVYADKSTIHWRFAGEHMIGGSPGMGTRYWNWWTDNGSSGSCSQSVSGWTNVSSLDNCVPQSALLLGYRKIYGDPFYDAEKEKHLIP